LLDKTKYYALDYLKLGVGWHLFLPIAGEIQQYWKTTRLKKAVYTICGVL